MSGVVHCISRMVQTQTLVTCPHHVWFSPDCDRKGRPIDSIYNSINQSPLKKLSNIARRAVSRVSHAECIM